MKITIGIGIHRKAHTLSFLDAPDVRLGHARVNLHFRQVVCDLEKRRRV